MKRLGVWLLALNVCVALSSGRALAEDNDSRRNSRPPSPGGGGGGQMAGRMPAAAGDRELTDALTLAKAGRYADASKRLFTLSYSPRYRDRRMQIKYILGLALSRLKLSQVAAFQFIGVISKGSNEYVKKSLEELSLAADSLGDDTLLNFAISRINVDEFPRVHRDMLHYRIGEYMMRNSQFENAAQSFARVQRGTPLFYSAKYNQGLALAEGKQLDRSLSAFEELMQSRASAPPNDKNKVAGMMGKARVLYQKKSWAEAIEMYRQVPRDSEFWHDTLNESAWAMLRAGSFRAALSNFHSLHSAFYEDFYLPESLLLRSIVYLYICKYDEMDKVLNLFSRIYKPVYNQIEQTLKANDKPIAYFNMINDMLRMKSKGGKFDRMSLPIPYIVAQKIVKEADFQNAMSYVRRLLEEKKRVRALGGGWSGAPVGQYALKVLNTRTTRAMERAGKVVRNHLIAVRDELVDQIEQEGFARYESLNGRKEILKKKIAGKDIQEAQVDDGNMRSYYIENGYEYWPFRGEYWLDELGNYHYVGTQSCN